jgi:hypothetical protein
MNEPKKENEKKCSCTVPTCAKCLGSGCWDDNCQIHSIENKIKYRRMNPKRFVKPKDAAKDEEKLNP